MRVASIELRACCFKLKWAARISIRGELRRPTFGCEVVSRLAWSSIPPSCRDWGPLASRPKESVGGLHLWRRTRLAERAERISSAVSLLRMTLAMCGYSVSIILSRQYRKSCTCYGVRSRGRKMSAEGRKGESDRRASPFSFPRFLLRVLRLLAPVVTGTKGLNFGFLIFSGVSQTSLDFLSNLRLLLP